MIGVLGIDLARPALDIMCRVFGRVAVFLASLDVAGWLFLLRLLFVVTLGAAGELLLVRVVVGLVTMVPKGGSTHVSSRPPRISPLGHPMRVRVRYLVETGLLTHACLLLGQFRRPQLSLQVCEGAEARRPPLHVWLDEG